MNKKTDKDCATAGKVAPVVDRNRCEGKAECLAVCPYDVFEIRVLEPGDRSGLSVRGRLKAWAHGYRQAYVVKAADCHACQQCVSACPEDALTLQSLAQVRQTGD